MKKLVATVVAIFVAGCAATGTDVVEVVEGPCIMTKENSVAWPHVSRTMTVECQEGGAVSTSFEDTSTDAE